MMGLTSKGRLAEGKDADLTVIDPEAGNASYTIVGGELVMMAGRVIGTGGKILTTDRGEKAVAATGIDYEMLDLTQAQMYAGRG